MKKHGMKVRSRIASWVAAGMALAGLAQANQVTATREGQLVKIYGDANSNQILITQNLARDVFVTGLNGTLINGQAYAWFPRLTLEKMDIRMGGGSDVVTLSNLRTTDDLFVDLGAGPDRLQTGQLPCVVGGSMTFEGGVGNDLIHLAGWTVMTDLKIDGNIGPLTTSLSNVAVGFGLTIVGDNQADVVMLRQCRVGDSTSIETKGGNDRVSVYDFYGFDLFVSTDYGIDSVRLNSIVTQEDVGVFTGSEGDFVEFTTLSIGKNLIVSLDAGNDVFVGENVSAAFDAVIEGGAGVDTFTDRGVAGGVKTEIKEFETLL